MGKAGLDLIKDGRHTFCTAGYSPSLGLVRVYPPHRYSAKKMRRWNIVRIPVVRDGRDSRDESWKIEGSKKDWKHLWKKIKVVDRLKKPKRRRLVEKLADDNIWKLNKEKKSLGVVDPRNLSALIKEVDSESVQKDLMGDKLRTKSTYPYEVRIKYRCGNSCNVKEQHNQKLLEWGVYEFWRRNPDLDSNRVIENLRLNDDDYKKYLFVGNQRHHRTSFLVISVLRFKR